MKSSTPNTDSLIVLSVPSHVPSFNPPPEVVPNMCFHPQQIKTWDGTNGDIYNTHYNQREHVFYFEQPKKEGKSEPRRFTASEISHVTDDFCLINDDAAWFC